MIKSISYWSMQNGEATPIEDALAAAKREGFAGLEVAISPKGVISPESSQSDCQKIRAQIEKSAVAVQTLASGMSWGCSPTNPSESVRKQSIDLHAKALQRAAWLGCQAMLFV